MSSSPLIVLSIFVFGVLVHQSLAAVPSKIDDVVGTWSGLCTQRIAISNVTGNLACIGANDSISYPYSVTILSNGTIMWSSGGSIANVSLGPAEFGYIPTSSDYDGVSRIKAKAGSPGFFESDVGGPVECWSYAIENDMLIEYDEYDRNSESSSQRPCPTIEAANARAMICEANYYSYVCTMRKVSKNAPTPSAAAVKLGHSHSVIFTLVSLIVMIVLQYTQTTK